MGNGADPVVDAAVAPVGNAEPSAPEGKGGDDKVPVEVSEPPVDAPPASEAPANPHAITRQQHEAGILAEIEAMCQFAGGETRKAAVRDLAFVAASVMRRAAQIPPVMEHFVRLRHHLMVEKTQPSDDA